jgi:hypothetical protein
MDPSSQPGYGRGERSRTGQVSAHCGRCTCCPTHSGSGRRCDRPFGQREALFTLQIARFGQNVVLRTLTIDASGKTAISEWQSVDLAGHALE